MKPRHSIKSLRLIALLLCVSALTLATQNVWAVGTPSGTVISNTATMNYSVGGVTQAAIGSSPTGNSAGSGTPTTFLVDNKVNLTVALSNASAIAVSPGATSQVMIFTVTNNGNTAQGYNLVAANASGTPSVFTVAKSFDVAALAVFVDANGDGIYELADNATAILSLAPSTSISVFVLATIPVTASNGQQAVVTLTATTTTAGTATPVLPTVGANTDGVDIVFADAGNLITDPLAANTARDGAGTAQGAYRVAAPAVSVSKTATMLCDPLNGISSPKAIPGAIVQYSIIVANAPTAGASAILTTVTDTLDTNVTHDPGLGSPTDAATCIAGSGTSGIKIGSSVATRGLGGTLGVMTNAADSDGASIAGKVVTITFSAALPGGTFSSSTYTAGELKVGESATITYNAIVN